MWDARARDVVIYRLSDPVSFEVRYVGWCYEDRIIGRLRDHLSRTNKEPTHKAMWLRSLLASGCQPIMTVCETIKADQRDARERFWIAWYRNQGSSLVNMAEGGKGCSGFTHTLEARRKMSEALKGKPKSLSHRRALAAARRGSQASRETRRKMAAAHLGRRQSTFAIEKTAQAHRGMKRSAEACGRMRLAWERRRHAAPGS